MANFPIGLLKDDFTNNVIDDLWINGYVPTGSATRAETGGDAVFTLPSSTAGSHAAGYQTSATFDLTSDQVSINVDTMVSTSVAASASLYIFDSNDVSSWIRFIQLSGTLSFQKSLAGVTTAIGSNVTWSATTHKYWRIRESGGTILLDTSSNGTSWTNRGSVTTALSFVPTAVLVRIEATCGNVASPGAFKVEEVNASYPAPSSTWRYTTGDWSITNRLRPVTLASDGLLQGAIVTADTMDSAGVLGGTLHYYAGPLGAATGGYLALTEYASLALAQASAFPIPIDGRVDLPAMVDARYMRLYHRSADASSHTLYEFVPRRIVQADDIEAESIRAINISAGAVTADKIFVLSLSAITASMGALHMDGPIDITTGSIIGGGGKITLDSAGLALEVGASYADLQSYRLIKADGTTFGGLGGAYNTGTQHSVDLRSRSITGEASNLGLWAQSPSAKLATVFLQVNSGIVSYTAFSASSDATNNNVVIDAVNTNGLIRLTSPASMDHGLNVGAAVGATAGLNVGSGASGAGIGQISTSGSIGVGEAVNSVTRLHVKGASASGSDYAMVLVNSSGTVLFVVRNDNRMGFFGNTEIARPTVTGSRATDAWRTSVMAALSNLGLWNDSSTV